MTRRVRRASRGMSSEDKRGIIIFGMGVTILIALAIFILQVVQSPEKDYDRVSLCNEHLPRAAHHLMIIDVSDALSAHQAHFLKTHISGLLEDARVNDRFSIFVLDEKYSGLSEPVVDLCKPPSADDADVLTSNRTFIERLYSQRFSAPLETAVAAVVAGSEQKESPIFEALSDVAALRRIDQRAGDVRLTIVSDMIQNSRAGSVFDAGPKAIENLPLVNLRGVRTRVFWLDREKYKRFQTEALASSWEDYLASISRFEQIERVRN
ncbi:hypothetical protein AUP74_00067 [Microbulbifer aggregans]|uniref:VWFA domain-containing protein n=1 Tax=Microbulbifer aggregans TaxID=1769779 RepID=A0A1C9W334_9GAMM|nr:hypothetical protein [Microbulbifer aggregans]AOS95544.1 hypothetical protein AUP74_00067 [Microbulbifer aggregans]